MDIILHYLCQTRQGSAEQVHDDFVWNLTVEIRESLRYPVLIVEYIQQQTAVAVQGDNTF